MSMHASGFQSFSGFLHHVVLVKLSTSSIRVKYCTLGYFHQFSQATASSGDAPMYCLEYRMKGKHMSYNINH